MSHVTDFSQRMNKLGEFDPEVPVTWKDRRVTVRLTGPYYGALLLLARRRLDSPTGTAQALLCAAILDVLENREEYGSLEAAIPDIREVLGTDRDLEEEGNRG